MLQRCLRREWIGEREREGKRTNCVQAFVGLIRGSVECGPTHLYAGVPDPKGTVRVANGEQVKHTLHKPFGDCKLKSEHSNLQQIDWFMFSMWHVSVSGTLGWQMQSTKPLIKVEVGACRWATETPQSLGTISVAGHTVPRLLRTKREEIIYICLCETALMAWRKHVCSGLMVPVGPPVPPPSATCGQLFEGILHMVWIPDLTPNYQTYHTFIINSQLWISVQHCLVRFAEWCLVLLCLESCVFSVFTWGAGVWQSVSWFLAQ